MQQHPASAKALLSPSSIDVLNRRYASSSQKGQRVGVSGPNRYHDYLGLTVVGGFEEVCHLAQVLNRVLLG